MCIRYDRVLMYRCTPFCSTWENHLQTVTPSITSADSRVGGVKTSGRPVKKKASPASRLSDTSGQPRYWTAEEHARFLTACEKYGARNYTAVSLYVGTRTPKQVRLGRSFLFFASNWSPRREEGAMLTPAACVVHLYLPFRSELTRKSLRFVWREKRTGVLSFGLDVKESYGNRRRTMHLKRQTLIAEGRIPSARLLHWKVPRRRKICSKATTFSIQEDTSQGTKKTVSTWTFLSSLDRNKRARSLATWTFAKTGSSTWTRPNHPRVKSSRDPLPQPTPPTEKKQRKKKKKVGSLLTTVFLHLRGCSRYDCQCP